MNRAAPIVIVLAALAAAAPARAQEAETFTPTGHYQLRIADRAVPEAQIFQSGSGVPRLLLVGGGLPQPVLITAGAKTAELLDAARIVARENGDVGLAPGAGGPSAPLTVDGRRLKASVAGKPIVVEPREALVGDVTPEQMLAHMPEYRRNHDTYKPRLGDVRLLGTLKEPTEVSVFFGTWCPHCEKYVPRLIRVLQDVGNPNLKLRLHGLPAKVDEDPLARQMKITAVPMAFVLRGEQEVARLEGQNWEHPESALAALLFGM